MTTRRRFLGLAIAGAIIPVTGREPLPEPGHDWSSWDEVAEFLAQMESDASRPGQCYSGAIVWRPGVRVEYAVGRAVRGISGRVLGWARSEDRRVMVVMVCCGRAEPWRLAFRLPGEAGRGVAQRILCDWLKLKRPRRSVGVKMAGEACPWPTLTTTSVS